MSNDNDSLSTFKVGDKVVPFPTESGYLSTYLVKDSTYTITKIHQNGTVDVDGKFKNDGDGKHWDSDWFKPYEEDEVKTENTLTAESLRNSILSLQQERVSLQEQIEQNIAQEKALTEQLKELGFLLVESKEQTTNVVDETKSVLYAEDIEEDMADRRNWKKGDFVTVIYTEPADPFIVGDVVELLEESSTPYCRGENHSIWAMTSEQLKFHSRPIAN